MKVLPNDFAAAVRNSHYHPLDTFSKAKDETTVDVPLPPFDPITIDLLNACLMEEICPNTNPILSIEPEDSTLLTNGGDVDTTYVLLLKATNIPTDINRLRFEYAPGLGAPGSDDQFVLLGESSTSFDVSYPTPGLYTITASIYDDEDTSASPEEIASASIQVRITGTVLDIDPPGISDAEVGQEYSFTFTARDIGSSVSSVLFSWAFGDGTAETSPSSMPVVSGQAAQVATHTYTAEGAYGVGAEVRDAATNEILASSSVTVTLGPSIERNVTLDICDTWSASQSGGEGVTIDDWDITQIPQGAVFDLRFDAFNVPDKFLLDYPIGNLVLGR